MDPTCTQNPWAITAVLQQYCCVQQYSSCSFFFEYTKVSEGGRPTQGLMVVSRVRTRGMARLFDLGQGSSVNDSARLVSSLDADESQFCSAAMTAEVRIG